MFYTEGSIVNAYNAAVDLENVLMNFVTQYRKLANGVNGLTIDNNVVNIKLVNIVENAVNIKVTNRHYSPAYYQEPSYGYGYGCGDEEPSSTYVPSSESYDDKGIAVPFHILMKDNETLVSYLKQLKIDWDAKKAEEERLKQIEHHKSELAKLGA